jgi:exodeoxyribonuclease VII large subunit
VSETEPTFSVSELGQLVRELLAEGIPSCWVTGEIQRGRAVQRGHFYFELVEKGLGDEIRGRLDAVVWRSDFERLRGALQQEGAGLADGLEIRCRCTVDLYPPVGRLQLVVREVDPLFTLGLLAKRRRETLESLRAAGLLERNRQLELPELPLRVGLVTSHGSAAFHDFCATLRESGYRFEVAFVHAAVQGQGAEREILGALSLLGGLGCDCVAIVRGGGSRGDLAVFDGRALAEGLALFPRPVLTGLGHETDRSIADLVAHTAFKTPTKAAEFLVARVREEDEDLRRLCEGVRREAQQVVADSWSRWRRARERIAVLPRILAGQQRELHDRARSVARWGRGLLRRRDGERRQAEARLAAASSALLRRAESRRAVLASRASESGRSELRLRAMALDGLARVAASLSPDRILRRGFSVTRRADGSLVRDAGQVEVGDRVVTRLAAGEFSSRVEER